MSFISSLCPEQTDPCIRYRLVSLRSNYSEYPTTLTPRLPIFERRKDYIPIKAPGTRNVVVKKITMPNCPLLEYRCIPKSSDTRFRCSSPPPTKNVLHPGVFGNINVVLIPDHNNLTPAKESGAPLLHYVGDEPPSPLELNNDTGDTSLMSKHVSMDDFITEYEVNPDFFTKVVQPTYSYVKNDDKKRKRVTIGHREVVNKRTKK